MQLTCSTKRVKGEIPHNQHVNILSKVYMLLEMPQRRFTAASETGTSVSSFVEDADDLTSKSPGGTPFDINCRDGLSFVRQALPVWWMTQEGEMKNWP